MPAPENFDVDRALRNNVYAAYFMTALDSGGKLETARALYAAGRIPEARAELARLMREYPEIDQAAMDAADALSEVA